VNPRPRIGITTNRYDREGKPPVIGSPRTYWQAVHQAGGSAVLLPCPADPEEIEAVWWPLLDGVLFMGGGDVDPDLYQGQWLPEVKEVIPQRDRQEIALLRRAIAEGKPFLAICRGIQVLNVAMGGTLYEDIPSQVAGAVVHRTPRGTPKDKAGHRVRLAADSRLAQILGATELRVNTYHHQAIRDLAPGLRAVAWSECGLVEAVEVEGHPFGIGVQWHPELMAPDDPHMQRLFAAFIEAARAYAQRREAEA